MEDKEEKVSARIEIKQRKEISTAILKKQIKLIHRKDEKEHYFTAKFSDNLGNCSRTIVVSFNLPFLSFLIVR